MSCIHYKFKSSLDYNSVTFDGLHLSLGDLKKAISAQKRLKPGEFDLEITNAQTGDVYKKLDELIAKNTSVIVSRVPVTKTTASSTQRSWEAFKQECAKVKEKERQMTLEKQKQQTPDLASSQASEIDKIKAVIDLSTKGFEPSSLPGRHPSAVPSDHYVCKRCGKRGHYISHCPNVRMEDRVIEPRVKRTTGIPSTMLTIVDDPLHPGALLTSQGQFAVPTIDVEAYREGKKERPPFLPGEAKAEPEKKKIPQELLCHICEDLCVDAAIAPCCGTSFCDECLREELLESEDHQCPSCHETNVSPDRIVANRSMRIAVTNFLNDTGYTKVKRRRSSSAGGDSSTSQEVQGPSPPQPPLDVKPLVSSNPNITSINSSIQSTNISSTVPSTANDSTHSNSAGYPRLPAHVPTTFGNHNQNVPYRPRYHGYPSKHWPPHRNQYSNQSTVFGDGPRPRSYKPVEKKPWDITPPDVSSTLPMTLAPEAAAAVASQAVQAVQAVLLKQGHPILTVPPPTHLPFNTGATGYPPSYARPRVPGASVVPRQVPYAPPMAQHPKPLSKEEFYQTHKRMQSSTFPSKQVDIFDSFADLTQMRSPTPELRSRSTSPVDSFPKRGSRSRSNSPLGRRSLSRISSPRRLHGRSRSLSRPRSGIRSRSRSRPRSHLSSRSPSRRSRSQNRSRTRSPGQSRLSKVRSNSKSPIRRSKLKSRSPSKSRYSKPRSRSLSPLPPLRRSSKSPPSLRRSSKSPLPLRKSSKSPLPLRSRSRSRSFKRSVRTRSRSWSRARKSRSISYSPRRSPRRSLRSSLSPRRSYSPRRRSRSFSPKKKSPYRSRTRSPLPPRRYSRSRSKSPRPLRRSYSPVRTQRSKSPYRRPLSPLPPRRRSPSPYYNSGGGFRGRGRGRGNFNRDGFRGDRDRPWRYPSPPKHTGPNAVPNHSLPEATLNYPPVPYLPGMGIPPPEEFFKYNPAGYEEFVRKIYAQLGPQAHTWNPQQGNVPPPQPFNSYPPGQPPVQPSNRPPWEPVHLPPTQRPHSITSPGAPGTRSPPKHGDFSYRDGNRPFFHEKDREEMGRERRDNERRFDDRERRGDSRDRRMHFKDRRFEPRDRRTDDRERRVEDRDRRADDKERRGEKDRRAADKRRDKGDYERNKEYERMKDKDPEKSKDKGCEKLKDRDHEKHKDKDYEKSKDKDSSRSGDKTSSDKKKSPTRRSSKEAEKSRSKEKRKVDKNRDGKEKVKSKSRPERDESREGDVAKNNNLEEKKELDVKKETVELDKKSEGPPKSLHVEDTAGHDIRAKDTELVAEKPQSETGLVQPETNSANAKEKKTISKKKAGALGIKKVKVKDSDNVTPGEKKVKKIKKKKLTFGSSDADNKQGLKKKKLKRLVDYKSENNNMSEDGEHDKASLGVSPLKKVKTEDANETDQVSKAQMSVDNSADAVKPEKDSNGAEDTVTPTHQPVDDATDLKVEETPEKVESQLIPELPELSKWERDDFDLLDTLEAPKEKPKEKLMVPRSIVDKAEKFLSQKPMKNSVVAPALSASTKSGDESASPRHRGSRSKSPVSKPARKVYMNSRKDSRDRKSLDHIQITVKGDKRKNESSSKRIPLTSSKSNDDSYRRSHYHSKEMAYEEDERSVVKSSSLERELTDKRSSPVHRSKKGGSKQDKTSRDKGSRQDHSKRDQDRPIYKSRDRSPPGRQEERGGRPSKEEKTKPNKDLRTRIEEKNKAKSSVENRKMSVMDESEFVPDYDLAPNSPSDNEHTSPMSGSPSHDEKEGRKRKSEEEKEDGDGSSVTHKKAKKKHKHKDKKEKKEKHKHKKKKHKQKKSKEREDQE